MPPLSGKFRGVMYKRHYILILNIVVILVIIPYNLVSCYQRFGGIYCLHHQGRVKAALLIACQTTRYHKPEDRLSESLKSFLLTVLKSDFGNASLMKYKKIAQLTSSQ
jgi:hypothetical protein